MAIIAALSLAGSVVLAATANGIAVFMLFGAGLTAGLLGQIGEAISSDTLEDVVADHVVGAAVRGALPGRARRADRGHGGITRLALSLGPFGGAQAAGPGLWVFSLAYLGAVGALRRRGAAAPRPVSAISRRA